jgi:hypothetical protein
MPAPYSRHLILKGKSMEQSRVLDLNAFVPARDFDLSKRFYSDLGFTLVWGNDEIAQFQIGSFRFLQHAENFIV